MLPKSTMRRVQCVEYSASPCTAGSGTEVSLLHACTTAYMISQMFFVYLLPTPEPIALHVDDQAYQVRDDHPDFFLLSLQTEGKDHSLLNNPGPVKNMQCNAFCTVFCHSK